MKRLFLFITIIFTILSLSAESKPKSSGYVVSFARDELVIDLADVSFTSISVPVTVTLNGEPVRESVSFGYDPNLKNVLSVSTSGYPTDTINFAQPEPVKWTPSSTANGGTLSYEDATDPYLHPEKIEAQLEILRAERQALYPFSTTVYAVIFVHDDSGELVTYNDSMTITVYDDMKKYDFPEPFVYDESKIANWKSPDEIALENYQKQLKEASIIHLDNIFGLNFKYQNESDKESFSACDLFGIHYLGKYEDGGEKDVFYAVRWDLTVFSVGITNDFKIGPDLSACVSLFGRADISDTFSLEAGLMGIGVFWERGLESISNTDFHPFIKMSFGGSFNIAPHWQLGIQNEWPIKLYLIENGFNCDIAFTLGLSLRYVL